MPNTMTLASALNKGYFGNDYEIILADGHYAGWEVEEVFTSLTKKESSCLLRINLSGDEHTYYHPLGSVEIKVFVMKYMKDDNEDAT